jgi:tRNA A-37 threonylcarbamoyl transferase component Bud32
MVARKEKYRDVEQEIDYASFAQSLKDEWKRLCNYHLPIVFENSIWRFSRAVSSDDPEQGWKLHVSATILSANEVFKAVAPLLSSSGTLFKAPVSLVELSKINAGIYYGNSQVGKFITVYPGTSEDAVFLAEKLHKLAEGFRGPVIPYDNCYRANGCVYYRYGAFNSLEIENADGIRMPALRDPEGKLVEDRRAFGKAVPEWAADPFLEKLQRQESSPPDSGTETSINVFRAISQRGKGGVYRALDFSVDPVRLCILKDGRKYGETDWDGRDGYWRVRHEAEVLSHMILAGIDTPRVYTTFQTEHRYCLVTEFIEGETLHRLLEKSRRRLTVRDALEYGVQLAKLLHDIHCAGWVWRDCKPRNLILSKEGKLRPLDFEGACRIGVPELMPWGTVGYAPPEGLILRSSNYRLPEDLHALGATLHHLLAGQTPEASPLKPIGDLRKRIPASLRKLISALLDSDPQSRPDAGTVLHTLKQLT